MLGNKDLSLVLQGEHGAGVKAHAQRGDMGSERDRRRREFAAGVFAAVLRIRNRSPMAIGIAKVQSGLRRMIEFIRRLIIPEIIPTIICEPQVMGRWIPIESDRVPHSARNDLIPAAIRIHAGDQGIAVWIRFADIAWSTDWHIEFPVGTEGDELPPDDVARSESDP